MKENYTRVWYSVEQLPRDEEGFTNAREFDDNQVTKIVSETMDLPNKCVWLLVKYQVWGEKK